MHSCLRCEIAVMIAAQQLLLSDPKIIQAKLALKWIGDGEMPPSHALERS